MESLCSNRRSHLKTVFWNGCRAAQGLANFSQREGHGAGEGRALWRLWRTSFHLTSPSPRLFFAAFVLLRSCRGDLWKLSTATRLGFGSLIPAIIAPVGTGAARSGSGLSSFAQWWCRRVCNESNNRSNNHNNKQQPTAKENMKAWNRMLWKASRTANWALAE